MVNAVIYQSHSQKREPVVFRVIGGVKGDGDEGRSTGFSWNGDASGRLSGRMPVNDAPT